VGDIGRVVSSVVLAVLAGGWIALGRLAMPPLLGWATVAALGFTVAGYVLLWVAHAPVNARGTGVQNFAVFAGGLIGMVGAALVSGVAMAIGLAALAVMIVCARILDRRGPLGLLAISALAGLPFMYGALAVGHPAGGTVPWILASWLHLILVTISDLETEPVDRELGRQTIAIRLGRSRAVMVSAALSLGFIPTSLVLPARAGYGGAYFLVALFAQLAVLVAAARLIVGRVDGLGRLLKGAMVIGAVAMIAGRVT
jgi:4-hydroxybenzoate polyprenyltransferase